ncbi:hypothetical protein U4W40_16875, partial [Escherichia coli]|nr:hypothetical protein [Escherichia coli]
THDEPCSMAPDDKHDLISGTCSHLPKKSNKTISAQKNSAMRRLAIHSNAEMYAWINSAQGARELNLPSVYGDAAEWNTAELRREMSHS